MDRTCPPDSIQSHRTEQNSYHGCLIPCLSLEVYTRVFQTRSAIRRQRDIRPGSNCSRYSHGLVGHPLPLFIQHSDTDFEKLAQTKRECRMRSLRSSTISRPWIAIHIHTFDLPPLCSGSEVFRNRRQTDELSVSNQRHRRQHGTAMVW